MSPWGLGLSEASPLQRAIARILDGRPLGNLAGHPAVLEALGCKMPNPHLAREVLLLSGIRTAKSMLAVARSIRMARTCPVHTLKAGEIPRIPLVSLTKDNATVLYNHLVGSIKASPVLQDILVDEPTADSVTIYNDEGWPVEIKVTAGTRAGGSLVSRWLAGLVFDEAPRMTGSDEHVINLDDMRAAAKERILPGGQILYVGSPWAPFGPVYNWFIDGFGKPTANRIVIRARGTDMNPAYWTQERAERLKSEDPDLWATECAAEFASQAESFLPVELVSAAVRELPYELPPAPGSQYVAAIDPATRGNSWALVVATREGDRRRIVLAKQWTGSRREPLSPDAVIGEMKAILAPYGILDVYSDQWSGDALRDLAARHGLRLHVVTHTAEERLGKWISVKTMFERGLLELSPEPVLRQDLIRLRKRVTSRSATIELPLTSDGRHCDYAPALLLAATSWLQDIDRAKVSPKSRDELEAERLRAAAIQRHQRSRDPWGL